MYRVFILSIDDKLKGFGISKSKEYYLSCSEEVCDILTSLSNLNLMFNVCKLEFSSVDSVLSEFKPKEV